MTARPCKAIASLLALAPATLATAAERQLELRAEVVSVKPLVEKVTSTRPEKRCQWMLPTPFDHRIRSCTTREVERTSEKVRGYHVRYRFEGETYTTRLDHHPGSAIALTARITPIDEADLAPPSNKPFDASSSRPTKDR